MLSIVVPCYENHSYLEELYLSYEVAVSKIGNADDVELIFIDDCSNNIEVRNTIKSFKHATYVRNNKNLGLFGNWNKAFEVARFDFVFILSQDDYLHEDFIHEFFLTKSENEDMDLYYSNFQCVDDNKKEINHKMKFPFGKIQRKEALDYLRNVGFGLPGISMVIKRQLFLDSKKYHEKNIGSNDWILFYRDLEWDLAIGNTKKLVYYRKHEGSASSVYSQFCLLSQVYLLKELGFNGIVLFKYIIKACNAYRKINFKEREGNKYALFFKKEVLSSWGYQYIYRTRADRVIARLWKTL